MQTPSWKVQSKGSFSCMHSEAGVTLHKSQATPSTSLKNPAEWGTGVSKASRLGLVIEINLPHPAQKGLGLLLPGFLWYPLQALHNALSASPHLSLKKSPLCTINLTSSSDDAWNGTSASLHYLLLPVLPIQGRRVNWKPCEKKK